MRMHLLVSAKKMKPEGQLQLAPAHERGGEQTHSVRLALPADPQATHTKEESLVTRTLLLPHSQEESASDQTKPFGQAGDNSRAEVDLEQAKEVKFQMKPVLQPHPLGRPTMELLELALVAQVRQVPVLLR